MQRLGGDNPDMAPLGQKRRDTKRRERMIQIAITLALIANLAALIFMRH
jgi:hypothetical protein